MIDSYYYDGQLRRYLLQFCAIFSGLQVKTGKGADGQISTLRVPIHVGDRDRVVAGITTGNTQNRMFSLPIMAVDIQSIELAPERRKGIGMVDRRVTMDVGGVYPNDLKVVHRVMPIPYNLSIELAIYASNTEQSQQILEQIMMIFDPSIQIQTTDANFDWTKLTTVELTAINSERNYPIGTDKRMTIWSLTFAVPIYISPPMDIRHDIVHDIFIRIGEMSEAGVLEFDEEGILVPYTDLWTTVHVDGDNL
jgi:hypothetical protein